LLAGRIASPTALEWVGTWPTAQVAVLVPLLSLTLAILIWSIQLLKKIFPLSAEDGDKSKQS